MAAIQHGLVATAVAVAVALTAAGDARAAEAARGALLEPRQVTAQRASGPIRVDGALDEPAWGAAPVAEQFLQQRPAPGEPSEWLRGGPALALPPRDQARLSIHTDTRRMSLAGLDATVRTEPGSGSRSATVAPSLTLRLSDHIAGTLGASYQDQTIGWQLVASPGGPAVAPDSNYLVGRLHQRTLSLSLRADLAISPRLIVQLYAQPFATVGRYDRYARLADPRAARPEDRFTALSAGELTGDATMLTIAGAPGFSIARPDATGRSLIANAVARWELAPGSFLTAVWSHLGDAAEATTTARLGGELGRAAREPGSDTVLVKLGWRWAP